MLGRILTAELMSIGRQGSKLKLGRPGRRSRHLTSGEFTVAIVCTSCSYSFLTAWKLTWRWRPGTTSKVLGLKVFMDAHQPVTLKEGDRYPLGPPSF